MSNQLKRLCCAFLRRGLATVVPAALVIGAALAGTAAALPAASGEADRVRVAQAESGRLRPPEGMPEADASRMAGPKGNCHCDVKCTSTNGQSYNPGVATLGSKLWQHLENDRQQCQSRCQSHIDSSIASWASANAMCNSVTCSATSWVGTNTGKSKTSTRTIDRSAACQGGGGTLAPACCPPMTAADIDAIFTRTGDGLSAPYGLVYTANVTFDAKMRAAAQLANLAVACPSLVVTYTLRNITNNTVQGTATVVYTATTTTGPTLSVGFGSNLPINVDYQLTATVGCSNGREYYSKNCKPKGFAFKWTYTEVGRSPGQSSQRGQATLRVTPLE